MSQTIAPPPRPVSAEPAPNGASCRLDITGMDCGDCAKTIEASLASMSGVSSARVNFASGSADVAFDPSRVQQPELERRVASLGYAVAAPAAASGAWQFDVEGMDCGDCAKTIESGVSRLAGVRSASINFAAATLAVTPADTALTQEAVIDAVRRAGYQARPKDAARATAELPWWRRRRVLENALAALLWAIGFGIERAGAPRVVSAVPFLLAMAVAGYPVARAALFALRARRADMNVLMTIAAVGAIAIGRWDEGSSVLILFAIGLTLQTLTVDRTRRAIQALLRLAPAEATVRRATGEVTVPVAEVHVGETVIVRPGERVPVDGVITAGHSAVDQSSITGESVPVEVEPEAQVFAGTINGDGLLEITSTKEASDTTLAKIVHLVEEAQGSKAPAQAFVDRFAAIYTPVVVAIAILLATVVPLVTGDFRDWFFKALVLLVVACPCALVISTPVSLVSAIGAASRRGVLFKGGAAIEALAAVRAVAFDKTGTLTRGRPAVAEVVSTGELTADEVLARAAAVDQGSTHPIALGIVRAANGRKLAIEAATGAQNLPGRGASASVGGVAVLVGSRRLFPTLPDDVERTLTGFEEAGMTGELVGTESGIDGIIAVADPVREASAGAVRALEALGLRTVMLTGDNRHTAERIAAQVGVTDVRADLLPEDKVTAVSELQRERPVAMIGDGVNDAPALATATVGVAMGVAGSDVAIEAADVTLMGDELAQLPAAIGLARRTLSTIRQNIAASLLVKAVFLVLTFMGITNLWLAVLADTGMSLIVTLYSLRLMRIESQPVELEQGAPLAQVAGD